MTYMDTLRKQLLIDEGDRDKPYVDTVGKISIGIGRNLTDVGISQDEKELMFAHDLNRAVSAAVGLFPTFHELTENRKAVLCNMAFNMGLGTLSKFRGLIRAVTNGDYVMAATSMRNSLWAKQVGQRATRLILLMQKG